MAEGYGGLVPLGYDPFLASRRQKSIYGQGTPVMTQYASMAAINKDKYDRDVLASQMGMERDKVRIAQQNADTARAALEAEKRQARASLYPSLGVLGLSAYNELPTWETAKAKAQSFYNNYLLAPQDAEARGAFMMPKTGYTPSPSGAGGAGAPAPATTTPNLPYPSYFPGGQAQAPAYSGPLSPTYSYYGGQAAPPGTLFSGGQQSLTGGASGIEWGTGIGQAGSAPPTSLGAGGGGLTSATGGAGGGVGGGAGAAGGGAATTGAEQIASEFAMDQIGPTISEGAGGMAGAGWAGPAGAVGGVLGGWLGGAISKVFGGSRTAGEHVGAPLGVFTGIAGAMGFTPMGIVLGVVGAAITSVVQHVSVVCTELYHQGYITQTQLIKCELYRRKHATEAQYQGYLVWGEVATRWIRKGGWRKRVILRPCILFTEAMVAKVDNKRLTVSQYVVAISALALTRVCWKLNADRILAAAKAGG